MRIPDLFQQRITRQFGAEADELLQTIAAHRPPVSIRLNPQKAGSSLDLTPFLNDPVPWHEGAFYLSERPSFTHDPDFHAGAYYVQEAGSMLLSAAIRQLDLPDQPLRVLDLCGAPGGKSTLLLDEVPEDSLVICNEVIRARTGVLKQNLVKWGRANVAVTNHDPADFARLRNWFDLILVDAPCSGEGLFRRDPAAMQEWSPERVATCAARQRRILKDIRHLLRPGGYLIYSTCTYAPAENDENIRWLLAAGDFESVRLSIPVSWNLLQTEFGLQALPNRVRSEGFFMGVLQNLRDERQTISPTGKFSRLTPLTRREVAAVPPYLRRPVRYFQNEIGKVFALPERLLSWMQEMDRMLPKKSLGLEMGELKRTKFVPAHPLALSVDLNEEPAFVDLSREEALQYLRKSPLPTSGEPGWQFVRYNGRGLGCQKNVGRRTNNYLPTGWRILK